MTELKDVTAPMAQEVFGDREQFGTGSDVHADALQFVLEKARQSDGQSSVNQNGEIDAALKQQFPGISDRFAALLKDLVSEEAGSASNGEVPVGANLSRQESRICHYIRDGLGSKDIAKEMGLSSLTIGSHRKRIRVKLGLTKKGLNLTTYLRQINWNH